MYKQDTEIPSCYGLHYEAHATECEGGTDPTYDNGNGGHTRPPCDFRRQCASKTRLRAAGYDVPTHRVARPAEHSTAPSGYTSWQERRRERELEYAAKEAAAKRQEPPHVHVHLPDGFQRQQQAVGANPYGIPQYLSMREDLSRSTTQRLGAEVGRSMVKSLGHTLAHFMDIEQWLPPKKG